MREDLWRREEVAGGDHLTIFGTLFASDFALHLNHNTFDIGIHILRVVREEIITFLGK